MSAYNDLILKYESGMTLMEKEDHILGNQNLIGQREVMKPTMQTMKNTSDMKNDMLGDRLFGRVKGFCDADDICYGDMHPRISWNRTKTIGYGDDVRDCKASIK